MKMQPISARRRPASATARDQPSRMADGRCGDASRARSRFASQRSAGLFARSRHARGTYGRDSVVCYGLWS